MEQQLVDGIIRKLKNKLILNRRDITGLTCCEADYISPMTYEFPSDYRPLTGAELFRGHNTVFVKGHVTFPEEIRSDEDYEDCLFLRFRNLGGIVFLDGEPWGGIDENRDRIPLKKEWAGQTKELLIEGYQLRTTYDLDEAVPTCFAYAFLGRVDRLVEKYMYDIRLANEWYVCELERPQEDNIILRKKISAAFQESIRYLDFSKEGEALREAVAEAGRIFRDHLARIKDGDLRSHVSLTASTHIDVAWLWQLKDTVRKCGHSYSNILRLLDSYPEFRFSNSQVKLLAYTKEYYPALYEGIQKAAGEGRWENVGPMWVESDCNIVSGESLVRQILHGVNFLEKEFGSRPGIAWLPDTFGFQANLPQIFKKSGTDYFYSYKLHWQTQEKFPYGDFRWKGIDGSEVICAVIDNPAGAYNGYPNPRQLRLVKENFAQKGEVDEILFPYGFGDGGGGPVREMIEYAKRLEDFPGMPKCRIETARSFFERLEKLRDKLPVWYGELYIQTHRGTLTTEAFAKKNNRRAEMLYQSLEKLGVMAEQCGAKPDWRLLHEGWEKALVLQFHDILPGSSIDAVYDDCREAYGEIFELADRFLKSMGLDTQVRPEGQVRVVNTLSWERDILVSFRASSKEFGDGTVAVTSGRETMPCHVEKTGETAKITFLAKNVKGLSYRDYSIRPAREPSDSSSGRGMTVSQGPDGITVENGHYRASIDSAGRLLSLYDKWNERQVLSDPGNDIRTFLDGPGVEDAWNLYENYKQREVKIFDDSAVELAENNELRTVIRVRRRGEKTSILQDIIFYREKSRIDFRTCVDWNEEHKVMRVYFPTSLNAPYFTSETGFGAFSRPTVGNTAFERSRFEVAAHRWIDLSENGYGVALLNDSKYGHDVQYDTIGLTLLRSTGFPARFPDKGIHHFTYSLLPHAESWDRAKVARAAMELNAEIHTVSAFAGGQLAAGLLRCDNENLIIDTVKKAENGDGMIVRLYESNGTGGNAALSFGKSVSSVAECDLVEKKLRDCRVENHFVSFPFSPYEIKTFLVKFDR